jgi:DNA polymerase-1
MSVERLLLVDGTGLFYRSFYGIKGLSTRDGQPTNAVYGFIRAIHQILQQWRPSHAAVVWDAGVPAARKALLPEYKAQRPPMPEGLKVQYPLVAEFLERARIPLLRVEGEEADDVLASVVHRASDASEVLIISADKDLLQLVGDRVFIVGAAKDEHRMDAAAVLEKTGVRPGQIVDWLALTGDGADNIPGVEGLGPKTAARLLDRFGDLEALWTRLDEVEPARIRERLAASRETVDRNRKMVMLRRDLDCLPDWDSMSVRPEEPDRLRPFYERLEFHSLVKSTTQGELF